MKKSTKVDAKKPANKTMNLKKFAGGGDIVKKEKYQSATGISGKKGLNTSLPANSEAGRKLANEVNRKVNEYNVSSEINRKNKMANAKSPSSTSEAIKSTSGDTNTTKKTLAYIDNTKKNDKSLKKKAGAKAMNLNKGKY